MSLFDVEAEEFTCEELVEPGELWEQFEADAPEEMALDTEAPTYKWMLEGFMPFSLQVSWAKDRTYYVPWLDEDKVPRKDTTELCYKLVVNTPVLIAHNTKFDLHVIKRPLDLYGFPLVPRRIEDTMIMSHCLNEQRFHALKSLCTDLDIRYTDRDADELKNEIEALREQHLNVNGVEMGYDEVPMRLMVPYAVQDAYITLELFQEFKREMDKQLAGAAATSKDIRDIYDLELAFLWVCFNMEERGMRIDLDFCYDRYAELTPVLEDIRVKMRDRLGWEMNPGSTEDIAKALEQFGATSDAWINPKTKRPKFPEWVLVDIQKEYEGQDIATIAREVLEYREAQKLTSTYFGALIREHVKDEQGQAIVRCNVKQVGARTGRQSVTEPPLQTIPRETGDVKSSFIAREGHKLIVADYDQQELRVLAHYKLTAGNDSTMADIFAKRGDVHAETASEIYGLPLEDVIKGGPKEKSHRKPAKDGNFAIVYGAGVAKLKKMFGEALGDEGAGDDLLRRYHQKFPGIRRIKQKAERHMRTRGYIVTAFGRRHRVIKNREYTAVNSLIQGCSADLTKAAMVKVEGAFMEAGMQARVLLSVHDEIIVEAPIAEAERARDMIIEQMRNFDDVFKVPMEADIKICDKWSEAK